MHAHMHRRANYMRLGCLTAQNHPSINYLVHGCMQCSGRGNSSYNASYTEHMSQDIYSAETTIE